MAVRPGSRLGSGRSGIPYRRNSFGVAFSASNPFGIGGKSWKRFVPDLRAGLRLAIGPPLDGERSPTLQSGDDNSADSSPAFSRSFGVKHEWRKRLPCPFLVASELRRSASGGHAVS